MAASTSQNGCKIDTVDAEGFVVTFDSDVYRLSAIKKAAYKFGDRCHVRIQAVEKSHVRAILNLKSKGTLGAPKHLAGEFCNEVLDQELREVVAEETQGIRNLLLAHAFSKTSLIAEEYETADYRDDPSQIRPPDSRKPL